MGRPAVKANKPLRPPADLSNDISEGIPVTKAEVLRVLEWERANYQELLDRHHKLSLAMISLINKTMKPKP
jgi:hypothetical protein